MLNKEVIYYIVCPIKIKGLLLADEIVITTPKVIPV
jgi:hypothetical protein